MILIKNAEIYVGDGTIKHNHDILIKDKIISNIAKNISIDGDIKIIDAKGMIAMPGFVETASTWGAKGPGWGDNDLAEMTDSITPHLNSLYAFDSDAMKFQQVYQYGVTSFGFSPSIRSVIGGISTALKTYGKNSYDMIIKENINIISSVTDSSKKKNMEPMTKMGIYSLLDKALRDGQNYCEEKDFNKKNHFMKKIIDKEIPLLINAMTTSDLNSVNRLLNKYDIDAIIVGAQDINENVGKEILKSGKLVLGDIANTMFSNTCTTDIDYINRLLEDKVTISISCSGDKAAEGKESLLWNAILYCKRGLMMNEVLKMITINPAKILGIDDRVGSIEKGKDADILLWTNNPLTHFNSKLEYIFISGDEVQTDKRRVSTW